MLFLFEIGTFNVNIVLLDLITTLLIVSYCEYSGKRSRNRRFTDFRSRVSYLAFLQLGMPLGLLEALDKAEAAESENATNKYMAEVATGPNTKKFSVPSASTVASAVTASAPKRLFNYSGSGITYGNIARKYMKAVSTNGSSQEVLKIRPKIKSWLAHNSKISSSKSSGAAVGNANTLKMGSEPGTIVESETSQPLQNAEVSGTATVTTVENQVQQMRKPVVVSNKPFYSYRMEKQPKMPGCLKFTKNAAVVDANSCKPYTGRHSVLRLAASKSKNRLETPVCLTISSDEEEESVNDRMDISLPVGIPMSDAKECVQSKMADTSAEESYEPAPCTSLEADPHQQIIKQTVVLSCRSARIGTLKLTPCKVTLTKETLFITAETSRNKDSGVSVLIQLETVMKVLCNFGRTMPIIVIYVTPECGKEIRSSFAMTDKTGPYFDPSCCDETKRRIILLPHGVDEVTEVAIKDIFRVAKCARANPVLSEINDEHANRLLVLSTPKDVLDAHERLLNERRLLRSKSISEVKPKEHIPTICRFPPETGGIPITANDIACLEKGEFLNDVIIDFYLKYIFLNNLSESDRNRTHIFSSFFYPRLTTQPKMKYASNIEDINLPPSERRHSRVKNWTRMVDIFQKDFLIIPMNEHYHWFLAIICFPNLVMANKPLSMASVEASEMQTNDALEAVGANGDCHASVVKQPCIMVFDSLGGKCYPKNTGILREYLTMEWKARKNSEREFSKKSMPGLYPKIPTQNNSSDCGIYLLQYVESFFQMPIQNYTSPIGSLEDWFSTSEVNEKRQVIKDIISELSRQQKEQNERNGTKAT